MAKLEAWWVVKREGETETLAESIAWARELLRQHPDANIYIDGKGFTAAYEDRDCARDRSA